MNDHEHGATMTVEQAGQLLGISRRSAYRAAAAGDIPTIRLGRRILVPTARLYRLLSIDPASAVTTADTDGAVSRSPASAGLDSSRPVSKA
ncbi:MAG: helix-turn-helix domain-containing protein [Actinomycetota bacterium]|nr:helix-turn-helix domain-containing protein [Actinomycetota bacterium]